jgi:WD40 repeat protein
MNIKLKQAKTFVFVLFLLLVQYGAGWCLKYVLDDSAEVLAIDYSPDGSMIAVGLIDKKVRIYDAHTYI